MRMRDWIGLVPVFFKCFGKLPFKHLVYMAKQMRNEYPHRHDGTIHVNAFFPPWPSKAYDKFLEAVFERKRVPFSTYFAVTDKCPYSCPHCSYGKHISGDLDTDKAINVINQIRSIGTVTIGFTGGEPLVREDIVKLVESTGEDTSSVIFSTGYNLTELLAGELHSAGLDCMTIGIESDDAETHDRTRGIKGSFETAINAIETSLKAGLYTSISTVGSRGKLNDGTLERLAELGTKHGVHEFRVLEPIPTGSYCEDKQEMLTGEESKRLADFHKQWNRRGKGPSIACFAHLESDEMFGCGAGYHHLFIDAVGNVCPCDLTPLKLGNLLDEPLADVWERMGQWFDLPRCGCFMKRVCTETDSPGHESELPLCREKSEEICGQLKRDSELPKVFDNLFKSHKPADRPTNRQ